MGLTSSLLVNAYLAEAAIYRASGKETAALRLEKQAARMLYFMDVYKRR